MQAGKRARKITIYKRGIGEREEKRKAGREAE